MVLKLLVIMIPERIWTLLYLMICLGIDDRRLDCNLGTQDRLRLVDTLLRHLWPFGGTVLRRSKCTLLSPLTHAKRRLGKERKADPKKQRRNRRINFCGVLLAAQRFGKVTGRWKKKEIVCVPGTNFLMDCFRGCVLSKGGLR